MRTLKEIACGQTVKVKKLIKPMNVEDDAQTLYEQEYGKKNRKIWKRRKDQCKTWNMASNIEKRGT